MSMLKTWWSGGGKGDSEEDKSLDCKDEGRGEKQAVSPDDSVNPWVKGFGDLVTSVGGYASNLKETVTTAVQSTSFLSEFEEEQKKFERERRRQKDTAVPPWVGFNEEEQIKAQILELSADSRNVLRNPPPGIQFHFDFAKSYPVALALLKEDPRLQKLRFELVPKKLKEERFWHNYFYRVFLIKQSSQLASLTSAEQKETSTTATTTTSTSTTTTTTTSPPPHSNNQEHTPSASLGPGGETFTDMGHQDTHDEAGDDFASDALVVGVGETEQPAISRESVRAELDQLGVQQQTAAEVVASEEWEEELAKELEDLGLQVGVDEGEEEGEGTGLEGDEHWEDELKLMLESHSTDT